MHQLLPPQPQSTMTQAPDSRFKSPSPSSMIYTLLRHGRSLSHDEASRILCQRPADPDLAA